MSLTDQFRSTLYDTELGTFGPSIEDRDHGLAYVTALLDDQTISPFEFPTPFEGGILIFSRDKTLAFARAFVIDEYKALNSDFLTEQKYFSFDVLRSPTTGGLLLAFRLKTRGVGGWTQYGAQIIRKATDEFICKT